MTNEVTTVGKTYDPFAAAAAAMGVVDGSFLKFDGNTGDFCYGPKDSEKELPHGTNLIVDMGSPKHGYICWMEGAPVDKHMVSIFDGQPPPVSSLPDHGPYKEYEDGSKDGWAEQVSVDMFLDEDGTKLIFNGSSVSSKRSFGNLLSEYAKTYKKKPAGAKPVVELGAVAYEVKKLAANGRKIGKKYAPVFKIVDWLSEDDYNALLEGKAISDESNGGEDDPSNYVQQKEETKPVTTSARRMRASV